MTPQSAPYSIFCLLNGKAITSVYGHYADDNAAIAFFPSG